MEEDKEMAEMIKRHRLAIKLLRFAFVCLPLLAFGCGNDNDVFRPTPEEEPAVLWEYQNPLPQGNDLYSICADGRGGLIAVGYWGTLVRFDGSNWSSESIRIAGHPLLFPRSVCASSPSDIFVAAEDPDDVGGWGCNLYHFDGTTWSMHTDLAGRSVNDLWCSGPTDLYMACWKQPLLNYDGTLWSYVDTSYWFNGIWGSSPTIFAVGTCIVHYDGEFWEQQNSATDAMLKKVWGSSPSDVFAVGDNGTIIHYDGASWSPHESGTTVPLSQVWGSGPDDVYAFGDDFPGSSHYNRILHYDGLSWSQQAIDSTLLLLDLAGTGPHDAYLVGMGGVILHYDGTSASLVTKGTRKHLESLWGCSATDIYAVGDTILHYDGASWTEVSSPTEEGLKSIWGSDCSTIYAVGYNGTIVHFDGSSWKSVASPTTEPLTGVWGSSADDIFAVGYDGVVVHFDGASWTQHPTPTDASLRGVWGSQSTDVIAVGDAGTIVRYDGATWTPMESGTTETLVAVWGASPASVYAVGWLGTIFHYDGSTWTVARSSTNEYPSFGRDIWGSSESDIYALGGSTILHCDGTSWGFEPVRCQYGLSGVFGVGAENVFAVGAYGAIMKRNAK
jgi:hypothetical protein